MRITGFIINYSVSEIPTARLDVVCDSYDINDIKYANNRGSQYRLIPASEYEYLHDHKAYDILEAAFGKSKIKRVIFHDPATIVFWTDGSKTVVKTMPGDIYNPEVGLAMCISKKVLGDKYHHEFKKWLKEAEE